MIEATFLMPTQYANDAKWADLEAYLVREYGGCSRRDGVVGAWSDLETGVVHADTSREYRIALEENGLPELSICLSGAAVTFGQLCVYLTVSAESVYFVNRR